jgi:hypothetical protein
MCTVLFSLPASPASAIPGLIVLACTTQGH